ncbi:glycoside hydrolase family 36 protein [Microbacterium sp. SA39]|uniref:glycoside hydrolase family 36 protein n=1 Tax=Microbacterium sp. SA39 TaxID=1263625 RepID=UPI0005FA63A7|nr:glycoside hydrolase family 36 protein [Microbacterium sp. SA39]KJQ54497.1 Alpha-galactosidase [Microbacterium sp. SA39]
MIDFTWGGAAFPLRVTASEDLPVMVSFAAAVDAAEPRRATQRARPGIVELLVLGEGRGLNNTRALRTTVGDRLRHVSHEFAEDERGARLIIDQEDEKTGLRTRTRISRFGDADAYRITTTVTHTGAARLCIQQVTSATLIGLTSHLGSIAEVDLWSAQSEWCAESRWFPTALSGSAGLADINAPVHGHFARGTIARAGHSTWPTGEFLPTAALVNRESGRALAWEVENNGPWRWEVDTLFDEREALALALLGPTDIDHAWSLWLEPGDEFTTVPVTVAAAENGLDGAASALTTHRRHSHLLSASPRHRGLVFNDYMNALMGDPTTERLLPLIDAAASVGAEYFCIDAGWYDDDGDWWPSVGAWEPSNVRFRPLGLKSLLDHIRASGMVPGLWVEPEVIGVRSPVASTLPEDAFMHRDGVRIVEHDRYFLDLRSSAAREHLDGVFARLVEEYGAGYFKWDYNVTPGAGPGDAVKSPGRALLEHTRALLAWVEDLRARYPEIVIEACSSGAQRMDAATLARYDLQSTSDQQDYRLYPAIAASAPMTMPPEMAGNWAYPQSEWTDEQIAFTLVTGLSGRLYLSGNLDRLDDGQRSLVREATALYPELIRHHTAALPSWPLGLPAWDAATVALATETDDEVLVFVWNRNASSAELTVPSLRGDEVSVETIFPTGLAAWLHDWDADTSTLRIDSGPLTESARILRLRKV